MCMSSAYLKAQPGSDGNLIYHEKLANWLLTITYSSHAIFGLCSSKNYKYLGPNVLKARKEEDKVWLYLITAEQKLQIIKLEVSK